MLTSVQGRHTVGREIVTGTMKKGGVFAVYCVFLLVILAVGRTSALTGPPDSVCGPQCCPGWDQVGDTCQPHCYQPCEHGTCVDTNVCKCDPGWGGGDCSQDIDECWYGQHACHHNCRNHEGCYTCFCDDGFQLINSTHCVASNGSTTVEPPLMTTVSDSLCVTTTTTSTVGTATSTANPQQTTTRTTTSGIRNTAPTTAADVTTARRPQRVTSTTARSFQTSSTALTTAADVTTARRSQDVTTDGQQRVTRTTARHLHTSSTATTRVAFTTPGRPQRTTRATASSLHTSSIATTTTTARITTAKRPLRTTRTTEAPGRRHMTLSATGPIVQDNPKSPAPRARTDHQNVDQAIGGAVGAFALALLLISLGIIFCKRRKKAAARQGRLFSNLPQQPRGSLPGYSDTHWRNPAFENLYEEIPEARSPPPPYEATEGCGATGGFADVAAMSKGGITDRNNVDMFLAGTIPAVPRKALKEMSPPLCNLHVNIQKEPLADDHGYEPLKKVPGNEYESLKRW